MAENEERTQGNGKKNRFSLPSLPSRVQIFGFLNNLNDNLMWSYAVIVGILAFVLESQLSQVTAPMIAGYHQSLFSALFLVALVVTIIALFEAVRRNELSDSFWVIVAIVGTYIVANMDVVLGGLIYGLGFGLVYKAAMNGKPDFTPIVAYNSAMIGIASLVGANFIVLPIALALLFEVFELVRANNSRQAIALAIPGMVVVVLGLFISVNPMIWVLLGVSLSIVVVPTALKLYHHKYKKFGFWLKGSEEPCSSWPNNARFLRVNLEAAIITLVVAATIAAGMLIYYR